MPPPFAHVKPFNHSNIMELLKNLYSIHSMSGQENAMRNFIKKYVKQNIEGAVVRQDHGNLYIVKGVSDTYPCVVAHLDQVQRNHSSDFFVFEADGKLFGFSGKNARQEGLGADDKNGIWVALKCLEHFDAIKVALFKEEEIGCGGSRIADMSFFKDCRFAIQADRRNGGDLITDICGQICSDEFLADISEYATAHGYKATSGLMTDVETLSDNGLGLSCINFSCGYYNPHTDEEFTDVEELYNCLGFAMDIIENCTGVYPFERRKTVYPTYGGYGNYGGYKKMSTYGGWYDDQDDDELDWHGNSWKGNDDEQVFIPNFKGYADPEDAVFDFIDKNYRMGYDLYLIFDYIEADCETFGITYDNYCDIVAWMTEDDYVDDLPTAKVY